MTGAGWLAVLQVITRQAVVKCRKTEIKAKVLGQRRRRKSVQDYLNTHH